MRLSFLSFGLLALRAMASSVKEDSSMTVEVAEKVSCDGSHFIVSVQRTDDVRQDTGELIAEKVSNIVFDFKVDREAETLLINGYALKLVPQRVRKLTLLAAVIPPDHPAIPSEHQIGSVKEPDVLDALNKLDRNGQVTADVDLFIMYEGDVRQIGIRVQVIEVEGEGVIHKDILTAQITVPKHPHLPALPNGAPHPPTGPQHEQCASSDWKCRFSNWLKSFTPSLKPCAGRGGGQFRHRPEGHGGDYHRDRFHRPRHGFMRFIISVVIPVLIGAAAGVGIGIISVFIAEILGGILLRIRGRRQVEYVEVDIKDDEIVDELPVYEEMEEAPEYTEEKQ